MMPSSEPSERELADLAALADGSLAAGRRAQVEARLAASPEGQALLHEQRDAVRRVREAAVPAPMALRERIENQRERSAERARRRRPGLATVLAAAVAAAVLAVLLLPGAPGGPTVVQAAGLTKRGPRELPPAHADGSRLVSVAVDGIRFPYWSDAFGWEASGMRTDRLDGRRATTVFYDKGPSRIGYTIVSGAGLPVPGGVRADVRRGTTFRSFRREGRLIVTWRRAGHTCVLTGDRAGLDPLLALAAWR